MTDVSQLRRIAEKQLCIPAKLEDYQWEGAAFLYRSNAALLADEMGLGKTVQTAVALALLLNRSDEINRALIIAPTSLTINWMGELATWAPALTVRHVQGDIADRRALFLLPIPVLVGSYEQIRSDTLDSSIPANTFDLVILDEAQRIKNRDSTTALACRILSRKRAWALSATPLENHEDDVKSILSFLDPSIGRYLPKSDLVQKLEALMLRRRKSEVRGELPPVIFQDLKLDLSPPQRKIYDDLWVNRAEVVRKNAASSNTGSALLGLITRLKMICNFDTETERSSKLDALTVIVEGLEPSSRVLIFSQFVKTLKWISERIDIPHDLLTGDMPLEQRKVAINRFKDGQAPRMLLVSLRAGGVGLNLGEATHVILFDRWWNPAIERQAVYRAHRFDRNQPLHVIRFLVTDSMEERIMAILQEKERLFDDTIETVKKTSHRFTRKELMNILLLTDKDVTQHNL